MPPKGVKLGYVLKYKGKNITNKMRKSPKIKVK